MKKPIPNKSFPVISLSSVAGGEITIGGARDRWSMLIVYRGKHCPRCKKYLNKLDKMLDNWHELLDVTVVSADPIEKAKADVEEFGWRFDLCYGLTEDQMRTLGLYITDPLSPEETDRRFSEPGMFALRPDGTLMLVDISNGPAARPDLEELLDGMRFNIENGRPARGTVS